MRENINYRKCGKVLSFKLWIALQKSLIKLQKSLIKLQKSLISCKNLSFKLRKKSLYALIQKAYSVFHRLYKKVFKNIKNDEKPPAPDFLWINRHFSHRTRLKFFALTQLQNFAYG
jgi:hypothetical protein